MIWYTIPQAATRVHRSEETIRRWMRAELLTSRRNEIDGQRYLAEGELLQVERFMRGRQQTTRVAERIAS